MHRTAACELKGLGGCGYGCGAQEGPTAELGCGATGHPFGERDVLSQIQRPDVRRCSAGEAGRSNHGPSAVAHNRMRWCAIATGGGT